MILRTNPVPSYIYPSAGEIAFISFVISGGDHHVVCIYLILDESDNELVFLGERRTYTGMVIVPG